MREDLVKAVEEKKGGLAKEAPLEVTECSRKSVLIVRRLSALEALCSALDDDGKAAVAKIYITRVIQRFAGNYPSSISLFTRISGKGIAEIEAAKLDLEREYENWRKHMNRELMGPHMSIAIDIISEGKSFQSAGMSLVVPVSDKTAKKMAILACQEFVFCNRKDKPIQEVRLKDSREFVASKYYAVIKGLAVEQKWTLEIDA